MPNYESMYFRLFSATAEAVEALNENKVETAKAILIEAQREAEETYIAAE